MIKDSKGNEYNELEVRIKCDYGTSPSRAFKNMCEISAANGWIGFDKIKRRSFKMILRAASVNIDVFVKRKLKSAKLSDPIFALPVKDGFIFIGKV